MRDKIGEDIILNQKEEYIDKKIIELVKNNPYLIKENKILEIEFNVDGTKKDIYSLASERDIRETQIKSDMNEIEYKYYQKMIDEKEYKEQKEKIQDSLKNQKEVYNDLIFKIIKYNDLKDIEESIKKYKLNDIDLKRLASAITSVTNEKIEEFINNNKHFMTEDFEFWNYKYSQISKAISKSREVESFILNLI